MKAILGIVLVLVVAVGGVGYWQGWFSVVKEEGKVKVKTDPEKFKQDKAALATKAKALKEKVAKLWKKSEGLAGDEKARVEKQLGDLEKKHEDLENQLKALDETGVAKFDEAKQAVTKELEDVEKKMEELTTKLDKSKDK